LSLFKLKVENSKLRKTTFPDTQFVQSGSFEKFTKDEPKKENPHHGADRRRVSKTCTMSERKPGSRPGQAQGRPSHRHHEVRPHVEIKSAMEAKDIVVAAPSPKTRRPRSGTRRSERHASPADRHVSPLISRTADRHAGITLDFAASTATAASRTRSRTSSRTWHADLASRGEAQRPRPLSRGLDRLDRLDHHGGV
jgi:hypothetical protein